MTDTTQPSRKGLILGAAIVALYGKQQEYGLECRHFGIADPMTHSIYPELDRAIKALRKGEAFQTDFEVIHDLMAHTRQTLRVSYEEWDASVPLTFKTAR